MHLTLNLTAADARDGADRGLAGVLVEYGATGETPQGVFTVPRAGVIALGDGPVPLYREHDTTQPAAGVLTALDESDQARLSGRFGLLDTQSGRDALAEARAGTRLGLSVGLDAHRLGRPSADGVIPIEAATLTEVSLVRTPAFTGSGVTSVDATHRQEADVPTVTAHATQPTPPDPDALDDDQTKDPVDAEDEDQDDEKDEKDLVDEPLPVAVSAGRRKVRITATAPSPGEIAYSLYMRRLDPDGYERTIARITATAPHTLSTDVAGLIQKTVLDVLYAGAPVVSPVWDALPSLPVRFTGGAAWTFPKVTTHLPAAATAAEKTDVTHQFVVGALTGTAKMLKQAINVSEEAIDWSSPAAWDVGLRELARSMMVGKETLACTNLLAGATATPVTGTKWIDTLIAAATAVVVASGYPANTIFWSPDAYGRFQVELAGRVLAQLNYADQPWRNIISPLFPASTCLVGHLGDDTAGKIELGTGTLTVPEPTLIAQSAGIFATVDAAVVDAAAFVKVTPTPTTEVAAADSSKSK